MKKNIFIVFALVVALVVSCEKDPTEVAPPNTFSTNNFPQSINHLESILTSSYSNLRAEGLFGFTLLTKALSNSMHTVNSLFGGDQSWNEMANTNLNTSNAHSTNAWRSLFTGVKNCNVTLNAADFYANNFAQPDDEERIDQIRGQAHFLRAYYYFQLETLFGESYLQADGTNGDKMGMPIYDTIPSSLEQTQQARSTVAETWAFIESDLIRAAELLEGVVWDGNNVGRVTEWSAKGLLGKVYVFTEDWENARTTLLDVINNSGRSLMPYDKYRDAFIGLSENEFNEESLFELNVDPDSKGGFGIFSGAPNVTTIAGVIWSPFVLGGNGTVQSAFPLGFGNEFIHDMNIRRFGYPQGPDFELVPNVNFDSGQDPRYDNPENVIDPAYKATALQIRADQAVDPRIYVNAVQPWVDSLRFDAVNWAPSVKVPATGPGEYGWGMRKYSPILYNAVVGLGNGVADAWNYYLLRMAEVYLLYAEASIEAGDNATGLEYLNKVRRRAYSLPVDSPSPVDYADLQAETMAAASGDPVLGNNPLYYERWAELFNEGQWWNDVCRWRIGQSEAEYFETAFNVSGPFQWSDDKSYVWPIPLAEINSNSRMVQNPGY